MKKKTGIFLIIGIVLALMLTGCGKQSVETETAHTTEEDKLQIGLSFDSFVIERQLRDRDMFVSTAQSSWGRSKCAGGRRRSGGTDFSGLSTSSRKNGRDHYYTN